MTSAAMGARVATHPEFSGRSKERFAFGSNWRDFAERLDDDRIVAAERHVAERVGKDGRLEGRTFLDIGSGSGVFSLAAVRLGAAQVVSFDFDPDSVQCTRDLRRKHARDAEHWRILQGDVTSREYMAGLGQFDVVYAWGVLHHTGEMWGSLAHAVDAVASEGSLCLALYNDLGIRTKMWRRIKRAYTRSPPAMRPLFLLAFGLPLELRAFAAALAQRKAGGYVREWSRVGNRGMSRWHDLVDWIGGYPYEAAKPEDAFRFCQERGLRLEWMKTTYSLGNNEFVFRRKR
jgi:2-polyprenyl-3-methyl-5-hydroxy-6-metoxy-1,4-benzoquinol methylase